MCRRPSYHRTRKMAPLLSLFAVRKHISETENQERLFYFQMIM